MSEIKVDNLTGKTSAGDITVTSGAATMQLQQGLAKAWANFNGSGTLAVRDSLNVTSISDDGTGLYSVDFSNAMSDGNYAAPGCATYYGNDNATGLVYAMRTSSNVYTEHGTAGFALRISDNNADSALDSGSVELTVMGDLA